MGDIKTTISIDEKVWKSFSILVIQEKGHRKKNEVIEQLIMDYIRKKGGKKRLRWLPMKVVRRVKRG
jgi:metal-responsive CopG/Arc/MetJ family transcriptional regulator